MRTNVHVRTRAGNRRIASITAGLVAMLLAGLAGVGSATTATAHHNEQQRVDLATPTFSHPTTITNPLFPISKLTQVVQLGAEGDTALRHEITLLPGTRTFNLNGKQVETLAIAVRRLRRRPHPRGRGRLLRAGGRRLGLVLRRARQQLRGRRHRRPRRHLARRPGRPARDDHARASQGRRRLPAREHPRPRVRRGDGQGHQPDG